MKRLLIVLSLVGILLLSGCEPEVRYIFNTETVTTTESTTILNTMTLSAATSTVTTTVTSLLSQYPLTTTTAQGGTDPVIGLLQYLATNFGTCQTSLGTTSFTFDIYENTSISAPFDYWIKVKYDLAFFIDIKDSNQISTEMNHTVCNELRAFQQNIALAAIAMLPDKKIYGQYYVSGYRYPSIQEGYWNYEYFTWVNYAPAGFLGNYNDTHITGFTWYETYDDTLWR
jgi:hypothetical protein